MAPPNGFYSQQEAPAPWYSQLASNQPTSLLGAPGSDPIYALGGQSRAPGMDTYDVIKGFGSLPADSGAGGVASGFDLWNPSSWAKYLQDNGWLTTKDKDGIEKQGLLDPILGIGQGLMNGYLGMKQYGMVKDQFNFQKDSWNKEYAAQRNTINSQMADRQNRRNTEAGVMGTNPLTTEKYMSKYGVA